MLQGFPDPVPPYSGFETIDIAPILGEDATFGDVHALLTLGLRRSRYMMRTLGFREGFVVASQFERYDPVSLRPAPDHRRWDYRKLIPSLFSSEAIEWLFAGQKGDFRAFAFLLSDAAISDAGTLEWQVAVSLGIGDNYLPGTFATLRCGRRPLRILVYHYRSLNGKGHKLVPRAAEAIPVFNHLKAVGLLPPFTPE